jgi:periplasmic protein TonB
LIALLLLAAQSVPVPIDPSVWISDADYPAAAARQRAEGRVTYRLKVARDGRVRGCAIAESSGSIPLDEATCRLLTERARFAPRRGGSDTLPYTGIVNWRFPGG